MKRFCAAAICCFLLILLLSGCSGEVGGQYKLTKFLTDGREISPTSLSTNISFTLEKDGSGTAEYNGVKQEITWSQDGSTVYLSGEHGVLELQQNGDDLTVERENTIWVFELQDEEED